MIQNKIFSICLANVFLRGVKIQQTHKQTTYGWTTEKYSNKYKGETNSYNIHCIQPGIVIGVVNDSGNKGFLQDMYKLLKGTCASGSLTKKIIQVQSL